MHPIDRGLAILVVALVLLSLLGDLMSGARPSSVWLIFFGLAIAVAAVGAFVALRDLLYWPEESTAAATAQSNEPLPFATLPTDKLVALVGVVAALGYAVGWSQARGYYSAFRASWLLDHVSQVSLLARSLGPMGLTLAGFFLLPPGLSTRRVFLLVAIPSLLITEAYVMLGLYAGRPYPVSRVLTLSTAVLWSVYIGRLVRDWIASPSQFGAVLIAAFMAVYILPSSVGRSDAARDMDPGFSHLPRVRAKGHGGRRLRSLLVTTERVFAVHLRRDHPPRRVEALPWKDVLSLEGTKF